MARPLQKPREVKEVMGHFGGIVDRESTICEDILNVLPRVSSLSNHLWFVDMGAYCAHIENPRRGAHSIYRGIVWMRPKIEE